ncbi:hypothetical protein DH86_00000514 [Scytalidium sp. 3C]|nr:hypothetical protein DH86_00000514 [Scytalidium sp. 3C]
MPNMAGETDNRSESNVPDVPPVYSPRPIAVSRRIGELDPTHPQTQSGNNGSEFTDTPVSSTRSESQPDSPPSASMLPGLISPAFTPPSTPGMHTPSIPLDKRPARSVPVDSTLDDPSASNCGPKHPHLLEKLPTVTCIVRARIPTTTGAEMFLYLYHNDQDNKEHLAIVFGNKIRSKSLDAEREGETEMDRLIRGAYTGRLYPGRSSSKEGENTEGQTEQGQTQSEPTLVRIHSECYTGETVWSARCDCGEQLDEAARLMSLPSPSDPNTITGGVIIYLRQEGRGIGLSEKLKAYNLQDLGSDTVEANLLLRHPADARSYGLATAMLLDLGQKEVRLLTNNPDKIRAVEGPNREVVVKERVAMIPLAWRGLGGIRSKEVGGYLKTKIEKMGHMLQMAETS